MWGRTARTKCTRSHVTREGQLSRLPCPQMETNGRFTVGYTTTEEVGQRWMRTELWSAFKWGSQLTYSAAALTRVRSRLVV